METNFVIEDYCKIILPPSHRAAFRKFICGFAPLRIETDRYEGLAQGLRVCPFCNVIENEIHSMLYCHVYDDLRINLLINK